MGGKPVDCLDKQQIFNLVGPDEINSKVLKKTNYLKQFHVVDCNFKIVEGSSRLINWCIPLQCGLKGMG